MHFSEFSVVGSISLKLEIPRLGCLQAPAEFVYLFDRVFPQYTLQFKYFLRKGFK